jgi:hypothetical protein
VSGVQADWRLADLLDEGDPFGSIIYSTGLHVDLNASEEELTEALAKSLKIEGRLFDIGLTCPLKDGGQDCLSCMEGSADPQVALTRLCETGRDQCTLMKQIDESRAVKNAPLVELLATIDGFSEIGHLDDEYAELLTAVGL